MNRSTDPPRRPDHEPGPLHIADVLGTALRRLGVQREVREVQLREALAEVVGPAVAPLCDAISLQRGTLLVATRNGALAQQLQLEMPTIMHALNLRLGGDAVKRLRFTAMS
jgi:predicted nucleic acid-binding Zn ribbon protein